VAEWVEYLGSRTGPVCVVAALALAVAVVYLFFKSGRR
jgi:hypothetical protein